MIHVRNLLPVVHILGCVSAIIHYFLTAFKVPLMERHCQGYRRLTRDALIDSFLRQKDVGFPLLRRSLMTKAERETERRAKETSDERQARQGKVATQMARTRASETSDERQARQEKDVK